MALVGGATAHLQLDMSEQLDVPLELSRPPEAEADSVHIVAYNSRAQAVEEARGLGRAKERSAGTAHGLQTLYAQQGPGEVAPPHIPEAETTSVRIVPYLPHAQAVAKARGLERA